MTPINTLEGLKDYAATIDRQKEVLQLSTMFSPLEKTDLTEIYNQQLQIVNNKIATTNDYQTAVNL